MVEVIRSVECIVKYVVDTNKDTYREEFDLEDFDTFDDMIESIREFHNRFV